MGPAFNPEYRVNDGGTEYFLVIAPSRYPVSQLNLTTPASLGGLFESALAWLFWLCVSAVDRRHKLLVVRDSAAPREFRREVLSVTPCASAAEAQVRRDEQFEAFDLNHWRASRAVEPH